MNDFIVMDRRSSQCWGGEKSKGMAAQQHPSENIASVCLFMVTWDSLHAIGLCVFAGKRGVSLAN